MVARRMSMFIWLIPLPLMMLLVLLLKKTYDEETVQERCRIRCWLLAIYMGMVLLTEVLW